MKYTIGISTYNRVAFWRKPLLWRSIMQEDLADCEILICDDGSNDGTLEAVLDAVAERTPACEVRVFRADRAMERRTSALAQNILIANAKGEYFIAMDDDGAMAKNWLQWLRSVRHENMTMYAELRYVTDGSIEQDQRCRWCPPGVTVINPSLGLTWGAVWCTPLSALKAVGGHDMDSLPWRGSDCRLGWAVNKLIPAAFARDTPFTFCHYGLSAYRHALAKGGSELEGFLKVTSSPSLTSKLPMKPVSNGGRAFWESGFLEKHYREVKHVESCL